MARCAISRLALLVLTALALGRREASANGEMQALTVELEVGVRGGLDEATIFHAQRTAGAFLADAGIEAVRRDCRAVHSCEDSGHAAVIVQLIPISKATEQDVCGEIVRDARSGVPTVLVYIPRLVALTNSLRSDKRSIDTGPGHTREGVTSLEDATLSIGSWSPDGRWIAVGATIGGNADLFVVRADGGAIRRLTNSNATEIDPEWSRDGQWIYFSSNASGAAAIWKMRAAGDTPERLTSDVGFDPRESPDGGDIYFIDRNRLYGLGRPGVIKRVSRTGGAASTVDIDPPLPGPRGARHQWSSIILGRPGRLFVAAN